MSTLRVSNIEAKADVSSPSVNEKVKVTNSNGELLIHIDGATSGITTVGISTSGESFRFDSNQNVTFFGSVTGTGLDVNGNADVSGNLNVGGVLTYEDVTNIDSVGVITARNGIDVTGGNVNIDSVTSNTPLVVEASQNNRSRIVFRNNVETGTQCNIELIDDDLRFVTNSGERVRIDSSGNMQVSAGQFTVGTTASTGLQLINDGTFGTIQSADLKIRTAATERLRITSGGQLLKSGQAALTSTSLSHPIQVASASDANAIAIIGRAADDIGELSFYEADKSTKLGELQYRQDHLNFRHRVGDIRFATGGTTERLRITSTGQLLLGIDNAVDAEVDFQIHSATSGNGPILNMTNDTGDCRIFFGQDNSSGSANAAGQIRYNVANNYLAFYANLAERVRIDSDGHLQIRRDGVATMTGVDTRHTRYIVRQTNGQEAILGSVFAQGQSGWAGDLVFATKDNTSNPSTGLTERMRLDHNGKLIIKGESNAELNLRPGSGSGNDIISFENSGGTQRGNITYDTDNNFLFFNVSQSERTRIDQNGTLSHGTTQDNPGDANSNTGFAIRANGKYFFSCAADGGHMNRNNAGYVLHARYGGNFKGGVSVNSTQTNFNQTSDYRLKENIVNLVGAIPRVKQLTPRQFNFIAEPDVTIDGFVAHEAALVVPEAVTGTHNEVDDNGNPVYQGIDNGKLVPLLTAALQEEIARREALEDQYNALADRITALEP